MNVDIKRRTLVCPKCGSERLGTIEQASIWQPATFTRLPPGDEGAMGTGHEDTQGRGVDVEWDAYDSQDVGDTETVGYCCKSCAFIWPGDGATPVPFVTPEEYERGDS